MKFYVKPPWVGERKFVHGILDLDPRSFKSILFCLFFLFFFLSEIMWLIKLIFYVEPSWVVALIFCSRYLGYMTKMAATPKYGKTSLKIFFSRTNWRIYSKFGLYLWGLQPIIVCSNDDPGMTLTYCMVSSILETKAFTWGKAKTMDILETVSA